MEKNLLMVKGDTFSFGVEFEEDFGGTISEAYFAVSQTYAAPYLFAIKTITNGGITETDTNHYRVTVNPADTDNVTPGIYNYSCKFVIDGAEYTIIHGTLTIVQTVKGD